MAIVLADVLAFVEGFADLFGLVATVMVGFGAVDFVVHLVLKALGGAGLE